MFKLAEINIYPIKSCRGISLKSANIKDRGLEYDRRWMLVDENNIFMTQRKNHTMAFINIEIKDDCLIVNRGNSDMEPLSIPMNSNDHEESVTVWDDTVNARVYNDDISGWFSDALNAKCRLVYMTDTINRFVEKPYAENNEVVSFADGYPFLIIGQESLNFLNSKLEEKLPMNRFRPNFVFSGGSPHVEDTWKKFKIGNNIFRAVKPCARCVITTVDQETGVQGKEPLKTLSTYREVNGKVLFGQNLLHEENGIVSVGDNFEVLESKI